jgi:putative Ca2+/H+ antiporter (TMEM165/GDT1 family)
MDWNTTLSTFLVVFIAELGDKTQLAIVTQVCKYRCWLPVFTGGSLALIVVSAIGVIGGQVLGYLIPAMVLRVLAAVAFIGMGVLLWMETSATQDTVEETNSSYGCAVDSPGQHRIWNWRAFSSTLGLLLLAELGDKTQLAVIGLSCREATPWTVFAGSALALTTVTALGVAAGQQLCKLIPERLLLRISAGVFVVMGVLIGAGLL